MLLADQCDFLALGRSTRVHKVAVIMRRNADTSDLAAALAGAACVMLAAGALVVQMISG